jgi:hypothetical protein
MYKTPEVPKNALDNRIPVDGPFVVRVRFAAGAIAPMFTPPAELLATMFTSPNKEEMATRPSPLTTAAEPAIIETFDGDEKVIRSTAFDIVVTPVPAFVMFISPTVVVIDVPDEPTVTLLNVVDMMMLPVEFPPAQLKFE